MPTSLVFGLVFICLLFAFTFVLYLRIFRRIEPLFCFRGRCVSLHCIAGCVTSVKKFQLYNTYFETASCPQLQLLRMLEFQLWYLEWHRVYRYKHSTLNGWLNTRSAASNSTTVHFPTVLLLVCA